MSASGQELERQGCRERVEVPAVGGRNPGQAERLRQRDNRRVDEPEVQIVEAAIQLGHSAEACPRKIGYQVVAIDDS